MLYPSPRCACILVGRRATQHSFSRTRPKRKANAWLTVSWSCPRRSAPGTCAPPRRSSWPSKQTAARRRGPQRRRAGHDQPRSSAGSTARSISTSSTRRRTCSATSTTCSTSRAAPASTAATACGSDLEKLNLRQVPPVPAEPSRGTWSINTHFLPAEIIASLRRRTSSSTCRRSRSPPTSRRIACGSISRATATSPRHRGGRLYLQHWGVPAAGRPADRHPDPSGLQRAQGPRGVPARSTAWPAIGRSSCSWPAASASGRSRRSITALLQRRAADPARGRRAAATRSCKQQLASHRAAGPAQGQGDGLHEGDRRADGGGRPGRLEAGRPDDVGDRWRAARSW